MTPMELHPGRGQRRSGATAVSVVSAHSQRLTKSDHHPLLSKTPVLVSVMYRSLIRYPLLF